MRRLIGLSALSLLACVVAGKPAAGAYDVQVVVGVPAEAKLPAEGAKLAPLPAGKKLAVVLYVDWSYRTAGTAVPLGEIFKAHGWRATFFLAGAKDLTQYAPKLEALGHEVATNLFSGGIHAYRDEMFSYSPQDIYNAIGALKSELNGVLQRPVITQLVRGHSVPYRDRIRAMDYLAGTHWYTHFVFFGRDSSKEVRLGYGGRGAIPIVRAGKLDESAFQQAEQKKARAVILGQGTPAGDYKSLLKAHGGKEDYWYATLGEFAATLYLQEKVKVSTTKVEGGEARVTLSLADDFNPLFLRAPISLDLGGKVVDVAPEELLGGPLEAKVVFSKPVVALPGKTVLRLHLSNKTDKQITFDKLLLVPPGFQAASHRYTTFGVDPGKGEALEYTITSGEKAGPGSFGFVPFVTRLRYKDGATDRTLLAAAELEVRPALGVEVYPYDGVPLAPGGSQTFMLSVDNIRAGPGRGNWKNLRGKFQKFIFPPEGPAKGTIGFPESDAFKVEPGKIDLELAAAGEQKTFYVTVTNTAPAKAPYVLKPLIRLSGEDRPLLLPFAGTKVYHVAKLGAPPLDEKGLLMYAGWDDKDVDLPHADRARGRKEAYRGAMGYITYGPGVLGMCARHKTTCLLDPYLNFNESEGTMMFWLRNDPAQKKPLGRDGRERLLAVATQHPAKNVDTALLGLQLHKRGLLLGRMMTVGPTYHDVRAKFKKTDEWQHVALTWSCPKKFMRILVDGEVRGECKDDGKSWHAVPCRVWPESYGDFMMPLSDDHGTYTSTMRDEFYIYNRPLSAQEIQEHIQQVTAKRQKAE